MALSYYITSRMQWGADEPASRSLVETVRKAFQAGVDYVQVREKDMSGASLLSLVAEFSQMNERTRGTRLLVNGRVDVAIASAADGVHLSFESLPLAAIRSRLPNFLIVGVSCHSLREAAEAQQAGADYIILGPVFTTPSKPGVVPLGLKGFSSICAELTVPVFALGGVDLSNARDCVLAGAAGIAGIRLFQNADNIDHLAAEIRKL